MNVSSNNIPEPDEAKDCRFCQAKVKEGIVDEFGTVWAITDQNPVSEGHHLVVTKRHTVDWFSMTDKERQDADKLIKILKRKLETDDASITGFNVGINCGESAGQTIFHAHIHLIPRRDGDTPDPMGGVRGVIPDRMSYCIKD